MTKELSSKHPCDLPDGEGDTKRSATMGPIGSVLGYQVLSIKTAARFAGVSISQMHRAARGELLGTARLTVFRIGRRVLTRTDWLDEWMRAAAEHDRLQDESQTVVA